MNEKYEALQKQIDELKEEILVIARNCPQLQQTVIETVNKKGAAIEPAEVKRCKDFVKKYYKPK
jgi:hypothetical protein